MVSDCVSGPILELLMLSRLDSALLSELMLELGSERMSELA